MFGTPVNIMPRYVTVSENTSGSPSIVNSISPSTLRLKPVAVTMMSASSSLPDFS